MSKERDYYCKVEKSSKHPHGWRIATQEEADAARSFEHKRQQLRKNIRALEEKLVQLDADADNSEAAKVFYDEPGYIYDSRTYPATNKVEMI